MANLISAQSALVKATPPGAISYPKDVADAIADVRRQGFTVSEARIAVCQENSKHNVKGKTGWTFSAIDPKSDRLPWEIWVFPDGIVQDESVAVDVEIVTEITEPDAVEVDVDAEITATMPMLDDGMVVDVSVVTEPLALPQADSGGDPGGDS